MKKLLILGLMLLTSAANAAATHFCDCSTGAHGSCAAGANGNAGTSGSPKQTIAAVSSMVSGMAAGDQVLFCQGGAWPAGSQITVQNANATKTSPIVFDSYTPAWGGTAQPWLRFNANTSGFYIASPGGVTNAGFTVRNLRISGVATSNGMTTSSAPGIFVYGDSDYVTLDTVTLEGHGRGVSAQEDNGRDSDHWVDHLLIKNSIIRDNSYSGIFIGKINDLVVEGNTFDNNGACAFGAVDCSASGGGAAYNQHSVYIAGGNRSVFRGNTITNSVHNATATPGVCAGPPITGHGIGFDWVWENNTVVESAGTANCYGIGYGDTYGQTNEGVTRFFVRGNTVVNTGQYQFSFNASPGIVIENNVAINTSSSTSRSAFRADVRNNAPALASTAFTFRNNSAFFGSGTSGSAVSFNASGTGTANVVTNNLVYIASGSSAGCWSIGAKSSADFTIWDYNLCDQNGSGSAGGINTPFTGAQATGSTSDPLLRTNPPVTPAWDMAVQTGSPAINTGNTTYKSRLAIKGYPAVGARDIGAYEFGSNP